MNAGSLHNEIGFESYYLLGILLTLLVSTILLTILSRGLRFTKWSLLTVRYRLARVVYYKTSLSVLIFGLCAAVAITDYFGGSPVVFASVLYASLFYMNETIRTEYPYLNIKNIEPDIIDAPEDNDVVPEDGQVLLLKFEVHNRGIGPTAPEVNFGIYPTDEEQELHNNDNAGSQSDDITPLQAEDTQPPTDLSPRNDQDVTVTVDVVERSMIEDNTVSYEVYLEACPTERYRFLRDRRRKVITYPDTITNE